MRENAILSKEERMQIIYERLKNASTPFSPENALSFINQVVRDVEDAHSGKAYEENPGLRYRGRMYGPKPDRVTEIPGGKLANTRGNLIYLFNDGSFVVLDLAGTVILANMRKEVLQ